MPFQGRVGILCSVVSTVVHFIEPLQMELFVDWLSRITVKITPVSEFKKLDRSFFYPKIWTISVQTNLKQVFSLVSLSKEIACGNLVVLKFSCKTELNYGQSSDSIASTK